jgi:hypothetical protein
MLADVAATAGGADTRVADERYRAAIALATELGMRPLLARAHLGLGRLCQRSGRGREAESHLTTAAKLLREMEMRLWRDQAEAALAAID